MKKLVTLMLLVCGIAAKAQTRADIFNGDTPITFLGIDFTQAQFVGDAAQWMSAGEVTNSEIKNKYIPAWNGMFTDEKEQKNFKVADAVHRTEVSYATDAVEKSNKAITKDFFISGDKLSKLSKQSVAACVKKYDLKGKTGIGLVFVTEEMKKGAGKEDPSFAAVWVTFVDMKSKSVLFTKRLEVKAGGFGFRNFWAGAWKNVLKEMKEDWKDWKREK